MTISILGCGWLGLPLGAALVREGQIVNGSFRNPAYVDILNKAAIHPIKADFSPDFNGDKDIFKADVLVIAFPPRLKSNGENYYLSQINAFCSQISLSEQIKKVVFISSTSVYGKEPGNYTEEMADDTNVLTQAEQIIQNCCETQYLSSIVLRMGGLMGYDREPCKYLNVQTSDLDTRVNYVFRDDAVSAIIRVIFEGSLSGIFNISSPIHPTRGEILNLRCGKKSDKIPLIKASKIIDAQLFIDKFGFEYAYPDPLTYPVTQ